MAESNTSIRIALAGNPNCGKTTIFNNITGAKQHVGNYPGVTVEKKEGEAQFDGRDLLFIDLPGTYSLTARSMDELVARNVIINDEPDVIVNVLDASNLERNLYLAAQLLELERPTVIALNMADVAEEMGIKYDIRKLSARTGASVVNTVGRENVGTTALLEATIATAEKHDVKPIKISYGEALDPKIEALQQALQETGTVNYPLRWVAVKLLEYDTDVIAKVKQFANTDEVLALAEAFRQELQGVVDLDVVFQEYRHRFAVDVYQDMLISGPTVTETRSDKLDKILTHRILGLPIFMAIMWLLFNLVITVGAYPQDWLDQGFTWLAEWCTEVIPPGQLQSLVVDGAIGGVGAVLSFLPLIVLLFLGISFLEGTGYMARAAFVMDRIMRACGLHGKSFIPLLLGFGCSVPSIMGARILDNYKDRMVTIFVVPFMTCSARLPVYTLFAAAFFPLEWSGTVLFSIYFLGIIFAVIFAKLFRKFIFSGEADPFVMEMPPYHMPTFKSVMMHMWERSILYVKKAGTFILAASILVWFLTAYPQDVEYSQDFDQAREQVSAMYDAKEDALLAQYNVLTDEQQEDVKAIVDDMNTTVEEANAVAEENGDDPVEIDTADDAQLPALFADIQKDHADQMNIAWAIYKNDAARDGAIEELDNQQAAEKIDQSYAAQFGHFIEPVLKPLGFDWKLGVGLTAAMAAKEVLISTLGTIYAVGGDDTQPQPIIAYLQNDPNFTPLIAVALMVFVLVYPPCIAALAVIKRETNSWKWMWFMFIYENILAWVCAFIVYQGGKLLGF